MAKTQPKVDEVEDFDIPEPARAVDSELAVPGDQASTAASDFIEKVKATNDENMQNFITWLHEKADRDDDDLYATMAAIMSDILAAETPGDILREQTVLHARDVVGEIFLLHGVEIHEGTYEDSLLQHYAALTVSRIGSDKTRIITCGATKVLMKLYALDLIGEYPQQVMFKSKPAKKGDVLDLVRE